MQPVSASAACRGCRRPSRSPRSAARCAGARTGGTRAGSRCSSAAPGGTRRRATSTTSGASSIDLVDRARERLRDVGFALVDAARSQPLILAEAEVQVGEVDEAQDVGGCGGRRRGLTSCAAEVGSLRRTRGKSSRGSALVHGAQPLRHAGDEAHRREPRAAGGVTSDSTTMTNARIRHPAAHAVELHRAAHRAVELHARAARCRARCRRASREGDVAVASERVEPEGRRARGRPRARRAARRREGASRASMLARPAPASAGRRPASPPSRSARSRGTGSPRASRARFHRAVGAELQEQLLAPRRRAARRRSAAPRARRSCVSVGRVHDGEHEWCSAASTAGRWCATAGATDGRDRLRRACAVAGDGGAHLGLLLQPRVQRVAHARMERGGGSRHRAACAPRGHVARTHATAAATAHARDPRPALATAGASSVRASARTRTGRPTATAGSGAGAAGRVAVRGATAARKCAANDARARPPGACARRRCARAGSRRRSRAASRPAASPG